MRDSWELYEQEARKQAKKLEHEMWEQMQLGLQNAAPRAPKCGCKSDGDAQTWCEEHAPRVRTFGTGATRDTAEGKFEYAKYLSPVFLNGFARYMNKHQIQSDGTRRAGDNWQKGMPEVECLESAWRHFFDVWAIMRGFVVDDERGHVVDLDEAVYGLVFNLQVIMHQRMESNLIKRGAE